MNALPEDTFSEAKANAVPAPVGLLAELTYRCPLGCPYCSNPLELGSKTEELDTETWKRIFSEASALGVLHAHLSGGEPAVRHDLVELISHCAKAGLYSNLITSGIGLSEERVKQLADAGLDHIQLSIQDSEAASADHIAHHEGAFVKKQSIAKWVVDARLPLTINAVIHRANIVHAGQMVELAVALGARRVEIAHAQYYGWGLANRAALLPTKEQANAAIAEVEALRKTYAGVIVIDHVIPDYHARHPKACMGGWAKRSLNITPTGKALPCHAAETIANLEFWNVAEHSLTEIWNHSPGFSAFRGTGWMAEPCRSCERKDIDFGGCRCQALALTGDASATDPVCQLSPDHAKMTEVANFSGDGNLAPDYVFRRMKARDHGGVVHQGEI